MKQDYTIEYWLRVDGKEIKDTMIVVSDSQIRATDYVKSFIANQYEVAKGRIKTKIIRIV